MYARWNVELKYIKWILVKLKNEKKNISSPLFCNLWLESHKLLLLRWTRISAYHMHSQG